MRKIKFSRVVVVIGLSVAGLSLTSCTSKEIAKPMVYDGPLQEASDVELLYVEKNALKLKMDAKKIFDLQNGDRDFPEGLYLEFYDELGNVTSTLQADVAHYFKEDDKWRGRGNVIVKNIEKKQQLNTEELFWRQGVHKIFTDKFVTIKTEEEIVYGKGLDALEDLSVYKLGGPEGEFNVKE
jgi:LPS export ABC transporter protein LptC